MKRIAALLLTLMMCGCADVTELGDRAIIQLAAIDYEDGEYRLSALLFSAGGSSGEIDVTKSNVIRVEGSGKTIGEAVQELSLIDGRDIYMSEAKLLVLGNGFQQADIGSVLMALYRDMRCSLNMPVCCAEEATLLTELEFTEGITSAEKPLDMIENGYNSGAAPKTTMLDILAADEGGRSVLIPRFAQTVNGSGMTTDENGRTVMLSGSRVISRGRLGAYADMEQTKGAMLLLGLSDSVWLSFRHDGDELTCEAYGISAEQVSGRLKLRAHYRTSVGRPLSSEQEKAAQSVLGSVVMSGTQLAEALGANG